MVRTEDEYTPRSVREGGGSCTCTLMIMIMYIMIDGFNNWENISIPVFIITFIVCVFCILNLIVFSVSDSSHY